MDWTICPSCEEEFRIVSDNNITPMYCPYCGDELPIVDEEDEEDYE
jgi:predicted RNA-binding Zn-ribbon protein involved in translation (DUF1610 family)